MTPPARPDVVNITTIMLQSISILKLSLDHIFEWEISAAMKKRPILLTILCWFQIIGGLISLASLLVLYNDPVYQQVLAQGKLPASVQISHTVVWTLIGIYSSILMLARKSIGRSIYIVILITSQILSLFLYPITPMVIPSLVVIVAVIILLYRPKVNEYFSDTHTEVFD